MKMAGPPDVSLAPAGASIVMSVLIGVLFTAGVYMLLQRSLTRVLVGLTILTHAANLLLHASDHPHDHGTGGERLLAALTDEERRRVLSGNAADWYRLG